MLRSPLRFPKGRYNGRPIVGVELTFKIALDRWYWLPRCNWRESYGQPYLWWFCFLASAELVYGLNRESDRPQ